MKPSHDTIANCQKTKTACLFDQDDSIVHPLVLSTILNIKSSVADPSQFDVDPDTDPGMHILV